MLKICAAYFVFDVVGIVVIVTGRFLHKTRMNKTSPQRNTNFEAIGVG